MLNMIPLIAFIPGLFGYPSSTEALLACESWADKGQRIRVERSHIVLRPHTINLRYCKNDAGTDQYLGLERPSQYGTPKVVKRFHF